MSRRIEVEWVNVTYRSVSLTVLLVVACVVAAGGGWYYLTRHAPMTEAREAISKAESRLVEARRAGEGQREVKEVLTGARESLDEARSEFAADRWSDASVAAIHSDTLSLKVLSMVGGERERQERVRFYRISGDVRVKPAGTFSWRTADAGMELEIGDQVKTSGSASAQLIYFDGTITTIRPGSLLEIRDVYEDPVTKVSRVREKLTWGEVRASRQRRSVRGSYHEVATATVEARSETEGEFRVAFDKERKTTQVDVYDGRVQVRSGGQQAALEAGERVGASSRGRLTAKEALPGIPRLLAPSDQRVFIYENPDRERLSLSWEAVPRAKAYRLSIATDPLFADPLYDSSRAKTNATIEGVAPGSYFWRVAAVAPDGTVGPFSAERRFRVSTERIRDKSDTEPPRLAITEFVHVGSMVIVNGQTEPGATLWVDSEKFDVNDDGSFYAVVKLRRDGVNELKFVAQDTAGNRTTETRTAILEYY